MDTAPSTHDFDATIWPSFRLAATGSEPLVLPIATVLTKYKLVSDV